MYGQMTAGSWIYIGTQGILQGTYETLAAVGRRHFGGSLAGRLFVTAGLGGMGGAQPLAATMNGARRARASRSTRRASSGGWPRATWTKRPTRSTRRWSASRAGRRDEDGALDRALRPTRPTCCRQLVARGVTPDVADRPDLGARPAERLRAERPDAGGGGCGCASSDPARLHRALACRRWRAHVAAMLALQRRGAVVFDYGNNIRAQARKAGVADAFDIPGFVPEYVRPLFCEGKGPFRWAALSGDPADIARDRSRGARAVPARRGARPLDSPRRASASRSRGCRRASAGSGYGGARGVRPAAERAGPQRRAQGADRDRPRPPRHRIGRVAEPRDRRHARRQRRDRRLADAERAAERVVRRHLGVGAPRRRRRHRLLAARGHGHRRRRHARRRTSGSSACSPATRASGSRATPTPATPRRIATAERARRRAADARARRRGRAMTIRASRAAAPRRRRSSTPRPRASPCSSAAAAAGARSLLRELRERLGRGAAASTSTSSAPPRRRSASTGRSACSRRSSAADVPLGARRRRARRSTRRSRF